MTDLLKNEIEKLRSSGVLDVEWYMEEYPDVRVLGMDPVEHFVRFGAKLGRHPSSRVNLESKEKNIVEYLKEKRRFIDWGRQGRNIAKGVTVVTPTGDRIAAFNKCAQWLTTQTMVPEQWIIVDDGANPLSDLITFPEWVTYVRRERKPSDALHTLSENILAAIPHIGNEKILIFEDDDWYSEKYIEYMLPYLDKFDLVGTNTITYYHLIGRSWKTGKPKAHTALAQTACTMRAVPKLKEVCQSGHWEVREKGIVDRHWWHSFDGSKSLVQDHPRIHVGFKGLFGRAGIAEGHDMNSWGYKDDQNFEFLSEAIGNDIDYYRSWSNRSPKPWVVYTAIADGFDTLKEPIWDNSIFDFVVFSDKKIDSPCWQWCPFDQVFQDSVRTAKKPKVLPHLFLPQYEWSIWIDANIFIVGDLKNYLLDCIKASAYIGQFLHPERKSLYEEAEICLKTRRDDEVTILKQVDRYRDAGMTQEAANLFECNFIVRKHGDVRTFRAMNAWWSEIQNGSRRDQISYPYALWKTKTDVLPLAEKGKSVRNVEDLYYVRHGDAKFEEYKDRIDVHMRKYRLKN